MKTKLSSIVLVLFLVLNCTNRKITNEKTASLVGQTNEQATAALFRYIEAGNAEGVKQVLNSADSKILNGKNKNDRVPLTEAAFQNCADIVSILLAEGASANPPVHEGSSSWVTLEGQGQAIYVGEMEEKVELTPLQWAIHYKNWKMAQELLSKGATLSEEGKDLQKLLEQLKQDMENGNTDLFQCLLKVALDVGEWFTVEKLLENASDQVNQETLTVIFQNAVHHNQKEVVEVLEAKGKFNQIDQEVMASMLDEAAAEGYEFIVNDLLKGANITSEMIASALKSAVKKEEGGLTTQEQENKDRLHSVIVGNLLMHPAAKSLDDATIANCWNEAIEANKKVTARKILEKRPSIDDVEGVCLGEDSKVVAKILRTVEKGKGKVSEVSATLASDIILKQAIASNDTSLFRDTLAAESAGLSSETIRELFKKAISEGKKEIVAELLKVGDKLPSEIVENLFLKAQKDDDYSRVALLLSYANRDQLKTTLKEEFDEAVSQKNSKLLAALLKIPQHLLSSNEVDLSSSFNIVLQEALDEGELDLLKLFLVHSSKISTETLDEGLKKAIEKNKPEVVKCFAPNSNQLGKEVIIQVLTGTGAQQLEVVGCFLQHGKNGKISYERIEAAIEAVWKNKDVEQSVKEKLLVLLIEGAIDALKEKDAGVKELLLKAVSDSKIDFIHCLLSNKLNNKLSNKQVALEAFEAGLDKAITENRCKVVRCFLQSKSDLLLEEEVSDEGMKVIEVLAEGMIQAIKVNQQAVLASYLEAGWKNNAVFRMVFEKGIAEWKDEKQESKAVVEELLTNKQARSRLDQAIIDATFLTLSWGKKYLEGKGSNDHKSLLAKFLEGGQVNEAVIIRALKSACESKNAGLIDAILVNVSPEQRPKVLHYATQTIQCDVIPYLLNPHYQQKLGEENIKAAFQYAVSSECAISEDYKKLIESYIEALQDNLSYDTISEALQEAQEERRLSAVTTALYKHLSLKTLEEFCNKALENSNTVFIDSLLKVMRVTSLKGGEMLKNLFRKACKQNNSDVVKLFLDNADVIGLIKEEISSCFEQACKEEKIDVVKLFLGKADVTGLIKEEISSCFEHACKEQKIDIVNTFLEEAQLAEDMKEKIEKNFLLAAKEGQVAMLTCFLENVPTALDDPMLSKALDDPMLSKALDSNIEEKKEVIKLLLKKASKKVANEVFTKAVKEDKEALLDLLLGDNDTLEIESIVDQLNSLIFCGLYRSFSVILDKLITERLIELLYKAIRLSNPQLIPSLCQKLMQSLEKVATQDLINNTFKEAMLLQDGEELRDGTIVKKSEVIASFANVSGLQDHLLIETVSEAFNNAVEEGNLSVVNVFLNSFDKKVSSSAIQKAWEDCISKKKTALLASLAKQEEPLVATIFNALKQVQKTDQPSIVQALFECLPHSTLNELLTKAVQEMETDLLGSMLDQDASKLQDTVKQLFEKACQGDNSHEIVNIFLRSKVSGCLEDVIPPCFKKACKEGKTDIVTLFVQDREDKTDGVAPSVQDREDKTDGVAPFVQGHVQGETFCKALLEAIKEDRNIKDTLLTHASKAALLYVWQDEWKKCNSTTTLEALLTHEGARSRIDKLEIDKKFIKVCQSPASEISESSKFSLLGSFLKGSLDDKVIYEGLQEADSISDLATVATIGEKAVLDSVLLLAVDDLLAVGEADKKDNTARKQYLLKFLLNKLGSHHETLIEAFKKAFDSPKALEQSPRFETAGVLIEKMVQEGIGQQVIMEALFPDSDHSNPPDSDHSNPQVLKEQDVDYLGKCLSSPIFCNMFEDALSKNNARRVEGLLDLHLRLAKKNVPQLEKNVPQLEKNVLQEEFKRACEGENLDIVRLFLEKVKDQLQNKVEDQLQNKVTDCFQTACDKGTIDVAALLVDPSVHSQKDRLVKAIMDVRQKERIEADFFVRVNSEVLTSLWSELFGGGFGVKNSTIFKTILKNRSVRSRLPQEMIDKKFTKICHNKQAYHFVQVFLEEKAVGEQVILKTFTQLAWKGSLTLCDNICDLCSQDNTLGFQDNNTLGELILCAVDKTDAKSNDQKLAFDMLLHKAKTLGVDEETIRKAYNKVKRKDSGLQRSFLAAFPKAASYVEDEDEGSSCGEL